MSIVDIPEKHVSNVDIKVDKRKIRASLIKSSSELFSCSIRSVCNRVRSDRNQRLVLKSFIPATNTSIFPFLFMIIYFLKDLSMNYMPGLKSPSCNTFPQFKIVRVCQN